MISFELLYVYRQAAVLIPCTGMWMCLTRDGLLRFFSYSSNVDLPSKTKYSNKNDVIDKVSCRR